VTADGLQRAELKSTLIVQTIYKGYLQLAVIANESQCGGWVPEDIQKPPLLAVTIQVETALKDGKSWAIPIYIIHLAGNFRCKYSVLELVRTQNGNITKCTSINWKVQKEKKKCTD